MVAYGKSLEQSRRKGWENAYLDYNGLKELLQEIGYHDKDQQPHLRYNAERFLGVLRTQVEKVSLFALARQGELADAIGFLRYGDSLRLGNTSNNSNSNNSSHGTLQHAQQHPNNKDSLSLLRESQKTSLQQNQPLFSAGRLNTYLEPLVQQQQQQQQQQQSTSSPGVNLSTPPIMDAYSYLGVELLHLLRFICINAVAIRKILKKHDKLLTATLLGEFKSNPQPASFPSQHNNANNSSGDEFVPHGSSRLVGGADAHLQHLANSKSISAITASFLTALSDFESTCSDDLSLTRFQVVMASIVTLRDAAQDMNPEFPAFLSRKAMTVTGYDLGGLDDGAHKPLLKFLLQFDPDSLLYFSDWQELLEWQTSHLEPIIRTNRARGITRDDLPPPPTNELTLGGVNWISMIINLMSTLLYTVNYYIVAPTANHYAILLGTDGAFGATLVGASSLAALFGAFLYSFWYTRYSFRSALLFSAACPCLGNLLYSYAITCRSMKVAICGRILVGFGSAEVVNRQLISSCVSFASMTRASALFVVAGAMGMSIGPLLAAILDEFAGRDVEVDLELPWLGGIIFDHVTSPGFLMAGLWALQLVALALFFDEPDRINNNNAEHLLKKSITSSSSSGGSNWNSNHITASMLEDSFVDEMIGSVTSSKMKYGSTSISSNSEHIELLERGGLANDPKPTFWLKLVEIYNLIFYNPALPVTFLVFSYIEFVDEVLISSCSMVCRRYFSWHGSSAGFLIACLGACVLPAHFVVEHATRHYDERAIMKYSIVFICVGLVAIANYEGIIMYMTYVGEVAWENASNMSFPVASSSFDDDSLESNLDASLHVSEVKQTADPYDWGLGMVMYVVFLSWIFMGTIILEAVDTSLMSKVTPPKLNGTFINSGLIATLIGTIGRVGGDSLITISALIDKSELTDFVNDTFLPIIPLTLICYWLVLKYYKLCV